MRSAVHPAREIALRRAFGAKPHDLGLLSVIIPVYNVQDYLADCLNSVISQSYNNLEIIVVDDGSTDGSLRIAMAYAQRDKRISVIQLDHGGNGRARNSAIRVSKGEFITFADSDDVVAAGAYLRMMSSLTQTQSQFTVGSSDRLIGSKRVPTKLSSRLHARNRSGISISEFPEILDDVFLWNKIFRRDFWEAHVGPIPEGVLYEDQETTARAYARADSFDVLDNHVYSWRQRPTGKSITQGKAELQNLKDRLVVASSVSRLLLKEASHDVVKVWAKRLFGSDLLPYFDLVGNRGDAYWKVLQSGTMALLALFEQHNSIDSETWASIDPHARVFLHLAATGTMDDVETVIAGRLDSGTGYEVVADGDRFLARPSYASESGSTLVSPQLECSPSLLQFESAIRIRDLRDGRGLVLRGHALVRGMQSLAELHRVKCVFTLADGTQRCPELPQFDDPRIDIDASDAFASHAFGGFELDLNQHPDLKTAVSVKISLNAHGHSWSEVHRLPIAASLGRLAAPEAHKSPRVVGFAVDEISETFTVNVNWGTLSSADGIYLSTAQNRIEPSDRAQLSNTTWRYTFELHHKFWGRDVYAYPSGAYTLRYEEKSSRKIRPIKTSFSLTLQAPFDQLFTHSNVTAWVADSGNFAVTLAAPLSMAERSKFGQRQVQLCFQSVDKVQVQNHVVFESFNGEFCTDSPAAIAKSWAGRDPKKVLYFSISDFSVPYPAHTRPLLRGSQAWVDIVRTARYLVNNNNFPFYFRKSADQYYLQTWHGSPLKKIGTDAPREFLSASYRRLMRREGQTWNLLIAQNAYSAEIMPRAFGYTGSVLETDYPRNDVLVHANKSINRQSIRNSLGIPHDKIAILYAPTWRDDAPIVAGRRAFKGYFDVDSMLRRLGPNYVLLNRGHHNAPNYSSLISNSNIIEVSDYPELNDLILASDALVTDYSSMMFDYALVQRPILLLAPDLTAYEQSTRGFYLDYRRTVPGPLFFDQESLFDYIAFSGLSIDESKDRKFLSKFVNRKFDDSSAHLVDALISSPVPIDKS